MPALDALCPSEYVFVNKTAIKLLGLETATYWAELMTVLKQVKKKGTVVNGYFKLNRKYIEDETGIPKDRQYACDAILVENGIMLISESNPDQLAVSVPTFAALLMNGEYEQVQENSRKIQEQAEKSIVTKKQRRVLTDEEREAKRRGTIANLVKFIVEPDLDLNQAYRKWVEALVGKSRINQTSVKTFVETIQKSSLPKTAQLAVIERAIANGWLEASWTIDIIKKEMSKNPAAFVDPQKTTVSGKSGQAF